MLSKAQPHKPLNCVTGFREEVHCYIPRLVMDRLSETWDSVFGSVMEKWPMDYSLRQVEQGFSSFLQKFLL